MEFDDHEILSVFVHSLLSVVEAFSSAHVIVFLLEAFFAKAFVFVILN
jgi:hypothetical protein